MQISCRVFPGLNCNKSSGTPSLPCFWPGMGQRISIPTFAYIPPMSPKNGFKGGPPRGVYSIRRLLERSHAAIAIADADSFVNSRNEDLAVPNLPSSGCGDDGLHGFFQ